MLISGGLGERGKVEILCTGLGGCLPCSSHYAHCPLQSRYSCHKVTMMMMMVETMLVIRKSSILEEVGSVCNGMVGMVVYFTLTWAFAPLAYIRFPDIALPDFYPCFQVYFSTLPAGPDHCWSVSGVELLHGSDHLCLARPGLHQVFHQHHH